MHVFGADRKSIITAACSWLTTIVLFHLMNCDGLTAAHLAQLLPWLPALQTLFLVALQLDSLSFLAQEPMQTRLATLQLEDCSHLPLAELRRVRGLSGLRTLKVYRSFSEPMDSLTRFDYTPGPECLMPQLAEFLGDHDEEEQQEPQQPAEDEGEGDAADQDADEQEAAAEAEDEDDDAQME